MSPKEGSLDRRTFIELTTIGGVGLGMTGLPLTLSGCAEGGPKTVKGACHHDCPDRCSWEVTVENDQVIDFKASSDNPYTAGSLCEKMENFPQDVTYNPDRLLKPLKRIGPKGAGEFVEVSWEEAIADIASKLKSIINEHGGEAILPYSFGGNQGEVQGPAGARFFARVGASQLERTICGAPAVTGVMLTNGTTTGVLPKDLVHSKYIIMWGVNPVNSHPHLWRLTLEAREQGAKIVVIDPFKSRTAEEADWYVQPKPGTDTALALGMIHVMLTEGLQDQDYIDRYTTGITELTTHVEKYTPAYTAAITGLEEEEIVSLAREYAGASPSVIRVLIGMEHQANGASAFRAVSMLPSITGAWRELGGGLMHMAYELSGQALNWDSFILPKELDDQSTRSISMIQLGQVLNDPSLDPGIHALFVWSSNPAVTTPNQNMVIKGLEREDLLTVVLEHFMTDTARYADYVFPVTTVFEHWDILTSWGTPYLNINEPAIQPMGNAKPDSEFFRLLSRAMGFEEEYLYESDLDKVKNAFNTNHEYLEGITFESLRETGWARFNLPDPWMPHVEGNFVTASGKCEFYNPDLPQPVAEYVAPNYPEEELLNFPLQLLTIKSPKYFLNSSKANFSSNRKRQGKPSLEIHPDDAGNRGIEDGATVKVYNNRGEVLIPVRISDKVRPGIVCMPQGFWPSLMEGGSSANALTTDELTDMARGGAIQETRVQVVSV